MKQPFASIIIPTFNEEKNIKPLLTRITNVLRTTHYEVLFVDDNSHDRTRDYIKAFMRTNKRIRLYHRTHQRGLASAFTHAFTKARGRYFVLMDANLKHPPETIPELLAQCPHYDLVKASRYIPHGGDRSPLHRRLSVALLNAYAHHTLGGLHDYSSLYMAFPKTLLKKIPFPTTSTHGEFIITFLYRAHQKNLRIKEIPFIMHKRGQSASKAKLSHLPIYIRTILHVKKHHA